VNLKMSTFPAKIIEEVHELLWADACLLRLPVVVEYRYFGNGNLFPKARHTLHCHTTSQKSKNGITNP
jgi:hypothetical protein